MEIRPRIARAAPGAALARALAARALAARALGAGALLLGAGCVGAGCGARSSLPDGTGGSPEVCNGKDDDGNGLVDDVPPIVCGVGACRREVPGCVDGKAPVCEAGAPSAEVCNGLDDDCNGAVDDGLGFGPVAGPFDLADVQMGTLGISLTPTPSGLLALWALGFNGDSPFPNTRSLALGPDGKAISEVHTLMDRTVVVGPRAHPSKDGTVVFAACGRFGADDHATSGRTTAGGTMIGPDIPRTPGDRWCGGAEPDAIWTGQRHLFVWDTSFPDDPLVTKTVLDIADENGQSLESKVILSPADGRPEPRLAALPGRVALVAGRAGVPASQLFFVALDALGHAVSPVVTLDPPVAGGVWGEAEVVATAAGDFLILGANAFDPGMFRARLSADGEILEAPAVVDGVDFRPEGLTAVARPGAGFFVAGNADGPEPGAYRPFALSLDAQGNVRDTWFGGGTGEPFFFRPKVAVAGDRVFVLYERPPGEGPDVLRIRELGCVP
jgi:hypothetical protein